MRFTYFMNRLFWVRLKTHSAGNASVKAAVSIILLLVFTIFVLQNTEVVDIRLLAWQISLSRVLLLVGALAIGCIVGILIGWEAFGRRKKP